MTINPDPNLNPTEPALTTGVLTAAATAVIGLLVAFGLPITDGQQTAILAVVAIVAPIVGAWFTRGQVFSPATVAEMLRRKPS